jgi:hypothetical protein
MSETYGRWTVVQRGELKEKWLCRCECGTEKMVLGHNVAAGKSRSCGCLQRQTIGDIRRSHGLSGTPIYQSWFGMLRRCSDPSRRDYQFYGARGIRVCERWHTADRFFEDMASSWFEGATLDRLDSDKDYYPENCRWIRQNDQWLNRRNTIWTESPWGKITLRDAAIISKIKYETLRYRVKQGWNARQIFWEHYLGYDVNAASTDDGRVSNQKRYRFRPKAGKPIR